MRQSRIELVIFTLCFALASLVEAATFTVTTNADSGVGSLRAAIMAAEANAESDDIIFDADYTIVLASTLPTITTTMTIHGNGWDRTIIDGGNPPSGTTGVRAFEITSTGSLTLDNVMVRNCYDPFGAGAVLNSGSLSVINSTLKDNIAGAVYGGAIMSEQSTSRLDLQRSTFETNACAGLGADVAALGVNTSSQVHVTDCTFRYGSGSSLYADRVADFSVQGCTFTGASGSGVYLFRTSGKIVNSTLSGNLNGILFNAYDGSQSLEVIGVTVASSATTGLNIQNKDGASATVSLSHTIISGSGMANCAGVLAGLSSLGYNLDSGDTCQLSQTGDIVNTDPQLGALQDNGGPTPTQEPQTGSPVIDAGAADCNLATDQRGGPRPLDGDRNGSALCDIGAVEVGLVFADGFESGTTSAWSAISP